MPFFIRNNTKSKNRTGRGRNVKNQERDVQKKTRLKGKVGSSKEREQPKFTEEIESDSEAEGEKNDVDEDEISDGEIETPQEKKIRLAKLYLSQLQEEEAAKKDEQQIDHDVISHRLKQDVLEQSGRLHKQVADLLECPTDDQIRMLRGHQLSVTCVALCPDNLHFFSASKDCSIIKWSVESGRKVHIIHGGRKGTEKTHIGHTTHVLSLCISSDGQFLASGDWGSLICIWDPSSCSLLHTFKDHQDSISGLVFQHGSHQLFSASHDRTVRVWNLDEMAFVETLYGHQDQITDVDCLSKDRAISTGGRDGSIRIWKILEESQLVYNGHRGSIERVSLINEQNFITGGEDNCLSLWHVSKKKACHTRTNAHVNKATNDSRIKSENWICSLAALKYTDLIASGSKDGFLRLWKCSLDATQLDRLFEVPINGFINDLQFSKDGSILIVATGQEHKLGRWWRLSDSKNAIYIIKLTYRTRS